MAMQTPNVLRELKQRLTQRASQPRPQLPVRNRPPSFASVTGGIRRDILSLACSTPLPSASLNDWLVYVAAELCCAPTRFGRSLRLSPTTIEDTIRDYPRSSREQRIQLLYRWIARYGEGATVQVLIEALLSPEPPGLDSAQDAEGVCAKLQELQSRIRRELEEARRLSGVFNEQSFGYSRQLSGPALKDAQRALNIAAHSELEKTKIVVEGHQQRLGKLESYSKDLVCAKKLRDMETDMGTLKQATTDLSAENAQLRMVVETLQMSVKDLSSEKQRMERKVMDMLVIIDNLSNQITLLRQQLDHQENGKTTQNHSVDRSVPSAGSMVEDGSEVSSGEQQLEADHTTEEARKPAAKPLVNGTGKSSERSKQVARERARLLSHTASDVSMSGKTTSVSNGGIDAAGRRSPSVSAYTTKKAKETPSVAKGKISRSYSESANHKLRTKQQSADTVKKYTYAELKCSGGKELPKDVERTALEEHLCDADFLKIFKMTAEEFHTKPSWKKERLKKDVGLF